MDERPQRVELRSRILDIASALIEEGGLEAVQARRIATLAGCSVGSIYNVVLDLDELIMAANARSLDALKLKLAQADQATQSAPLQAKLLAFAHAYLEFATARPLAWRAIFRHTMSHPRPVPAWYRDKQAELFALVEQALVTGIAPARARHQAARALFSSVHGIVTLAVDGKLADFALDDTWAQITFLIENVVAGLATRKRASSAAG